MPASPPPYIAQILHGAKSLGSGIVIGPTLILTCAHVVRSVTPKTNLTLEIAGKPFRGKVLFRDNAEEVDLAAIQLTRALEQSAIAWCAAIRENDQCEAIGFPTGIFESMPTSVQSRTNRQILIRLELPKGASGGALVKLVDGHPHCVGVLRQRHEPGISRVIAMAAVQAFLDKHGISLPTLPPPTLNRKYDTARYLESLRKETCEIDLDAFNVARERPPAMDVLYIPLKTPAAATKKTSTIERHPVTLESALVHRLLIVEGEAGSGKTTFLRRIAWALCRPDKETRLKLPFSGFAMFIRVSDLDRHIEQTLRNPRPGDPTLGHHARWIPHYLASRGWGLDEAFFAHQLALADSILLLDGLDEAADAPRRERISKLVKEACARGCRYVISMRPRADEGRARLDGFFKCHVEPLDLAGIQLFLRAWCEWRGKDSAYNEGLLHDVNHTPRDLRTNPLMLTALAVVYLKDKHLPEQRAALYEAIVTWLAAQARQRWGDPISETDLLRRLSALALAMQQWKGGQALALPVQSAAEAIAHTFDAAAPLEAVVAFLERAQLVSGIVTLRGNNEVAFWHRTFREYLAARALSAMREKDRERIARKFLHSAEGREVLPLLAGRMEESGHDLVHDLFAALLSETEGKSLKENAHAAGVIGKMLSDLKRTAYALPKEPASAWEALLKDVMAIFDPIAGADIPLRDKVAAAEALGAAGDPRLRMPSDPDYWVRIDAGKGLDAFDIGRFPVTVQEYAAYMESDASAEVPRDWEAQEEHRSRPVVGVSLQAATSFCEWVSVSLSSDAQWDLAARGEEGREYPWGPEEPDPPRANYTDTEINRPSPVGLFPRGNARRTPEDRGISDLAGNVWEWTGTPVKEQKGAFYARGASFLDYAGSLRAALRLRYAAANQFNFLGFRCVREA